MSEKKNIYQKLATVKAGLKIKKELENSYAGFKYASLDTILEEVNRLLLENDLSFNIIEYNDTGDRLYKIKAILTDGEKNIEFNFNLGGAVITTKGKGETFEQFIYKIQDAGSAITYITRYIYGVVFSIPFEEDEIQKNTGNNNYQVAEKIDKKIVWLTDQQFNWIKEKIQAGQDLQKVSAVIKKYTGTTIDGIQYKMKKSFQDELENLTKE